MPMPRGYTFGTGPSLASLWNRWAPSHKENILLMSAASDSRETEIGERLTPSLTTTKIECDYGGRGNRIHHHQSTNGKCGAPPQPLTTPPHLHPRRRLWVQPLPPRDRAPACLH